MTSPIVKVTLKFLLDLLSISIILGEGNLIICCMGPTNPNFLANQNNNTDLTNTSFFFKKKLHTNVSFF